MRKLTKPLCWKNDLLIICKIKALKDYGCIEVRNTSHGVIIENPNNNKSTNVPTHQDILPVWIYKNILRQLSIPKKELENYL